MSDARPRTFTDAEVAKVDALLRIIRATLEPVKAEHFDEEWKTSMAAARQIAIATLTEAVKPRQPAKVVPRTF